MQQNCFSVFQEAPSAAYRTKLSVVYVQLRKMFDIDKGARMQSVSHVELIRQAEYKCWLAK